MKWIRNSHRNIPLDVELPAGCGILWLHGMRNLLVGGDTDGVVGSSATGGSNGRDLLVGVDIDGVVGSNVSTGGRNGRDLLVRGDTDGVAGSSAIAGSSASPDGEECVVRLNL